MNTYVIFGLRAAQGVFTAIVLGTTAYVANWWTNYWRDMSPSEINFLIFASVWSLLSLIYLLVVPMKFPRAAPQYALLAVDGVAMTFWFAGFVALAVFLSSRICFGNVCNVAKAAIAFSAIDWALFAATTIISGIAIFRTRGSFPQQSNKTQMTSNPTGV